MSDLGRIRRIEQALASRSRLLGSPNPASANAPHIIEFATDPRFLGRQLYPRQATLLKILFLEDSLLTDYDMHVIGEWESDFTLSLERDEWAYVGSYGIPPGTRARMQACQALGRRWFREVVLVMGRRSGKGFISSVATAYLLWTLLATGNPQEHFALERTKQISVMVFGVEKESSAFNLFGDVRRLLEDAPCFRPYLDLPSTNNAVRLFTPAQLLDREQHPKRKGRGLLVADARATTAAAGRGPAAIGLLLDEMAHLPGPGLERSADEVYRGAMPALAQFGRDSLTIMASSPRDQLGEFHNAYRRGLAAHADGTPVDPTVIAIQLPSWSTYEDWELTQQRHGSDQ